jgi:hypothetical protein
MQSNNELLSDDSHLMQTACYGNDRRSICSCYDRKEIRGDSSYLITSAITELPYVISQLLDSKDICCNMRVGKFVSQLIRVQREEFSEIISNTSQLLKNNMLSTSSKYLQTSLPTSSLFFDNLYIHGKNSLLENLPYPYVQIVDQHGYVSISDFIAHLLSFRHNFSYCRKVTGSTNIIQTITDSKMIQAVRGRAIKIFGNAEVIVLITQNGQVIFTLHFNKSK